MTKEDLLNTEQMAEFVNQGFVRLDEVIPKDLCNEVIEQFETDGPGSKGGLNKPLSRVWPDEHPVRRMIYHPKVMGAIESLVGPDPLYDHCAVHKRAGNSPHAQFLHQDAEIDMREDAFDIQISFFVQDVPLEMGGTRFLPGSHFRRVHESVIARYQQVKGMYQVVCKAGTVLFWHHNLWHGAQPNHTDVLRYMFKLRLNPTVKQQLLWNTDDLKDTDVGKYLFKPQLWYGQENRIEQFNRTRMWRFLTNNPKYDVGWFTRIENEPN
ncbi:MAG: phytanoyl-CoA dioxygenase family protein [Lentisphaeria bacterium]|nr:phytanoyl-CoA dioxygenase family protein [Lentisphaeria bacterium]NQZ70548.1 phytanoyl-CoA dioxygenase family protein [Lentisphaeria bacterium]